MQIIKLWDEVLKELQYVNVILPIFLCNTWHIICTTPQITALYNLWRYENYILQRGLAFKIFVIIAATCHLPDLRQWGETRITREKITKSQLESSFRCNDARFGGLVLKLKDAISLAISDEEPTWLCRGVFEDLFESHPNFAYISVMKMSKTHTSSSSANDAEENVQIAPTTPSNTDCSWCLKLFFLPSFTSQRWIVHGTPRCKGLLINV